MSSLIFVIDSYLSNLERADVCRNLILQIRKIYPEKKILLINKYTDPWGLDSLVDHYYYYGEGFMVGRPSKDLMSSGKYEIPYTYIDISCGTIENWLSLTNVTDHVANIFNSFLISSVIARMLGYDKIIKIEYDTTFDEEEFKSIEEDIESFQDYLFYGNRTMGEWGKPHHYLVDVHIIGYSTRIFDSFNLIKNDEDFWNLCERVGYYGKWIEYIISSLLEERKLNMEISGIDYPGEFNTPFKKTKFDAISSPGEWADQWKNVPKICNSGNKNPESSRDTGNLITIFYWNNNEFEDMIAECIVEDPEENRIMYERKVSLNPRANWAIDTVRIEKTVNVTTKTWNGENFYQETRKIGPSDLEDLPSRFLFND